MRLEKESEDNMDNHLIWKNLIIKLRLPHNSKEARDQSTGLEGLISAMITSLMQGSMTGSQRSIMSSKNMPR